MTNQHQHPHLSLLQTIEAYQAHIDNLVATCRKVCTKAEQAYLDLERLKNELEATGLEINTSLNPIYDIEHELEHFRQVIKSVLKNLSHTHARLLTIEE